MSLLKCFSIDSFESWFDIAVISNEGADEAIVEAEQRKNVLSMLHQVGHCELHSYYSGVTRKHVFGVSEQTGLNSHKRWLEV